MENVFILQWLVRLMVRTLTFHVSNTSSNLVRVTNRKVAQFGSALGLGPRGRRFESCLPDLWRCSSAG